MLKRIKHWLIQQFLPRYAYELLLEELADSKEQLLQAQREMDEQSCYIRGLEFALRQHSYFSPLNRIKRDASAQGGENED